VQFVHGFSFAPINLQTRSTKTGKTDAIHLPSMKIHEYSFPSGAHRLHSDPRVKSPHPREAGHRAPATLSGKKRKTSFLATNASLETRVFCVFLSPWWIARVQ